MAGPTEWVCLPGMTNCGTFEKRADPYSVPGITGPVSPSSPSKTTSPATTTGALERAGGILSDAVKLLSPTGAAEIAAREANKAFGKQIGESTVALFVNGALVLLGVVVIIGAFMLWGRTSSDPVARAGRKAAASL